MSNAPPTDCPSPDASFLGGCPEIIRSKLGLENFDVTVHTGSERKFAVRDDLHAEPSGSRLMESQVCDEAAKRAQPDCLLEDVQPTNRMAITWDGLSAFVSTSGLSKSTTTFIKSCLPPRKVDEFDNNNNLKQVGNQPASMPAAVCVFSCLVTIDVHVYFPRH